MGRARRVLLINDERQWSDFFKEVLLEHGYKVDIEFNATKGLNRLDAQKYDIVVLDSYVSSADRLSILNEILQKHPEERVVVVSASPSWKEGREVYLQGAIDYLSKSADKHKLLKALQEGLRKRTPLTSLRH